MAVGTGSEADCCDGDCLGRIPYASVLALVLCWIGVGLFCGFLYPAINSSVRQAEDILQLNVPFLEHIRLAFIIVCVLMVLFSLILVILGAVATGQNRQRIYGGWTSRIGGRVANGIFMGLTYLLYLSWLGAFSIVSVLTFCYSLMSNLCPKQFVAGKEQCWNLSKFAGLFGDNSVTKTIIICATNLQVFYLHSRLLLTFSFNSFCFVAEVLHTDRDGHSLVHSCLRGLCAGPTGSGPFPLLHVGKLCPHRQKPSVSTDGGDQTGVRGAAGDEDFSVSIRKMIVFLRCA